MDTKQQAAIAVGGVVTGGFVLTRVPPDLLLSMIGAGAVPFLAATGLYVTSSRFRGYVAAAGEDLDRLLNAPPDPTAMLAGLLADTNLPSDTARLPSQTPMPTHDSSPPVTITYHAALAAAWSVYATDAGLASAAPMPGTVDVALTVLCNELGVSHARVAGDPLDGQGHGPVLVFVATGGPLTTAQQAVLHERGDWWQPYHSGRVSGVLVLLAGKATGYQTRYPDEAAAPSQPATTERHDLLACPEADSDDTAEVEVVPFVPPQPAMTGDTIPAMRRPTQPTGPRKPDPLVPMARLVGNPLMPMPVVQITFGYNRRGEWVYAPLKHGGVFKGTGGGKCLAFGEDVFLADGRVVKAETLIGQQAQVIGVTDTDSMQQVPAWASFSDNGMQRVIEITLDDGTVLRRTDRHPLWAAKLKPLTKKYGCVVRATDAGWVRADDLTVRETASTRGGGHVVLCPLELSQKSNVSAPYHEVVLAAALLANGGLTRPQMRYTSASPVSVQEVREAAEYLGSETVRIDGVSYRFRCIDRTVPREAVRQFVLSRVGTHHSKDKVIPPWVFALPTRQIAIFLRVLVDNDGWVEMGENEWPSVNISLASERMVHQIRQLALRLGIVGSIRSKPNAHAGAWTFATSQVGLWKQRIGLNAKSDRLDRAVTYREMRDAQACTSWTAWRTARPLENEFSDCPPGYQWRKVAKVRELYMPTVAIEVHTDNHAFVGYAVEHNSNLIDLLMGQLQALGEVDLWYGTAKPFVPIDPTDRLDRRPLIANLPASQVAQRPEDILVWIWHAAQSIRDSYTRMQEEPGWFPRPTVIIFDEVKSYFDQIGKQKAKVGEQLVGVADLVEQQLRYLLVTAREAGGSVIFTSQDGYCGSINLTRGELGNLGFRAVHPGLDRNSLANVLPEGVPPMTNAGRWDWLCATADGVELVTVPRITAAMMEAWGLVAPAKPDAAEPEPQVDDAQLLRWVLAESRAGREVTVAGAAERFGFDDAVMRSALVRNGLLGSEGEEHGNG